MNSGFTAERSNKKAGTKNGPGIELAGCPDKIVWEQPGFGPRTAEAGRPHINLLVYAVLRGRTVKSRTWVRMLDICIPFSCETNGRISAMN
jgi:hypothetical protein